jgi:hypothetical protein
MKILIAGVGAVGSRVAYELAGLNAELHMVDSDKVEQKNVVSGNSMYVRADVGLDKVRAMIRKIYERSGRKTYGVMAAVSKTNVKTAVHGFDLIVDCFDNMASRKLLNIAPNVIHAGVSAEGTGMVLWNEDFSMQDEPTANPVCTSETSVDVIATVALATVVAVKAFVESDLRRSAIINGAGRIRWL